MLGQTLRLVLKESPSIMMPGAFSGLCGRLVAQNGFKACYVSGGAITANSGQPDIGMLGLSEFCNSIYEVSRSSGLPVLADADIGFGEGEMVIKTVQEYWRAGASAFHIEDQVFPKRWGHLAGKSLISVDHMVEKVQKAAFARDKYTNGEFIVWARTDAYSVEGFESTLSRAEAYVQAGADMIFPEGLHTAEEFQTVAKYFSPRVFLLANMTEFGKTPIIPFKNFEEWGYNVVIYPVSTLRIAMRAIDTFLGDLRDNGDVSSSLGSMLTRQELYEALQYDPAEEWIYPSPTLNPTKKT